MNGPPAARSSTGNFVAEKLAEFSAIAEVSAARARSAHELLNDFRETHLALDQGRAATLELDPTLVESVEHLDARNRIMHSLGAKDRAPFLARNGLCANRTM